MLKRLLLASVVTAVTAGAASAAPITGSFSLGLSSGSYVGANNTAATASTAIGLDFGMSSLQGGNGAGNGYGTNGSAVVYNAAGSFSGLNGSFASVADIALAANNVANPFSTNPFISLGGYTVSFTNASYTRSSLGTSVTVTGTASFADGVAADATSGNFSLATSSQNGDATNVQFTFTSNVSAVATSVPEPISLALLGSGLAGLGLVRRARRA